MRRRFRMANGVEGPRFREMPLCEVLGHLAGRKPRPASRLLRRCLCAAHPRGKEESVGPPSFATVDEETITPRRLLMALTHDVESVIKARRFTLKGLGSI